MKLKLLILACFTVLALGQLGVRFSPAAVRAVAPQQKLPGDDLIIPSVDEKHGEVKFTHQQHLAFSDCTYCHHTNKGLTLESFNAGKAEKVPFCAECHVRKKDNPKTPWNSDGIELWSKEAYHMNCIDCHKGEITRKPKDAGAVKKQGKGPTGCSTCHKVE